MKGEILLLKGDYTEAIETLNKASQFVNINNEAVISTAKVKKIQTK